MIRLIFFFNKLIYCLSFKRIYFNWFKNLFAQFSLLCINLTLNEPCFSPRILNIAVLLKKRTIYLCLILIERINFIFFSN